MMLCSVVTESIEIWPFAERYYLPVCLYCAMLSGQYNNLNSNVCLLPTGSINTCRNG